MAVKKATTTADLSPDQAPSPSGYPVAVPGEGEVLGGPPAEDPTPTVAPGDPVPETLNLTGSSPDKPVDKAVSYTSPWGSKVTVSSDANQDDFANLGFKKSKK